jgi:hypothetical protein
VWTKTLKKTAMGLFSNRPQKGSTRHQQTKEYGSKLEAPIRSDGLY